LAVSLQAIKNISRLNANIILFFILMVFLLSFNYVANK
jgi:hypothetical protein